MRFPFTHFIERGDEEIELHVIYDVSEYVPARLYGDYPHPAEGGEVEIISVKCDGAEFGLYPHEEAALLTACEERCRSDIEEEANEAAEWRAQERRDALLMGEAE